MNACCTVFLGFNLLFLLAAPGLADVGSVKLSNSTFQDWNGSLAQMDLNDGSVLNEYVAKTMSGSVDGASLIVSFFPRFNCVPVISVMVEASAGIRLDSELNALDVRIDRKPVDFPVLLDGDANVGRYSLNADQAGNSAVLAILDSGSRASFDLFSSVATVTSSVTSENRSGGQIEFSLLGSRLSTQAAKEHCETHIPLTFDN